MQENNLAATPEVTPPVLTEQPKQSNFLTILLSILLIISVSISGLFAFQTQKLVKELNTLKTHEKGAVDISESIVEPVAIKSSEVDLTMDWKTYTSNQQLDIPESYFEKFLNFKNDLPKSFTFKYPSTWKIVKFGPSEYQKTVNLGYLLYKSDPAVKCGNEGGGGPCENSANILFRFGMTDLTVKDFDESYWGEGYPIGNKKSLSINGVEVDQAYPTITSQYPIVSLFKIVPGGQFYVKSEFFNNDKNDTQYSKETISEINQIISTFKFLN